MSANHLAGRFKSLKLDNDSEDRPSPKLKARLTGATDTIKQLIQDWYEEGCSIDVEFRPSGTGDEVPDNSKRADFQGEITSFKIKAGEDGHPEPEIKLDLQPDSFETKELIDIWAEAESEFVMVLESIQMEMGFDEPTDEGMESSTAPEPSEEAA